MPAPSAPAVKQKLGEFSDHAFRDLTKGVELGFQDGQVTIKAPIMIKAGRLGPYTVKVVAESPTKLKGTLKPETISATVEVEGRKYKYTADIAFDVTVTLNPTPPKMVPEVARETVLQTKPLDQHRYGTDDKLGSNIVTNFLVTLSLIIIGTAVWQSRVAAAVSSTTSMGPFLYQIEMGHPRHQRGYNGPI